MNIDMIRERATAFDRRSRRQDYGAVAALTIAAGANFVAAAIETLMVERVGDVLSGMAALYVLSYYFRWRDPGPARLAVASIDYYRHEIIRRKAMVKSFWRLVLPFVPGILLSTIGSAIAAPRPLETYLAAGVVFVATVIGIEWLNRREARRLERELRLIEE